MKSNKFCVFEIVEKDKVDTVQEFIRVSPFFDILKKQSDLKVLDLGCRLPNFLWLCYHIYDCQKLVGIELNTEKCVIWEQIKDIKPMYYEEYSPLESLYEWYLHAIKPDAGEPPLIQSKEEYEKVFQVHFETDIKDFLRNETEQYDLINASNILHFLQNQDEVEEILNHIFRIISPNGYVFIKIQNSGRDYFDYPRFRKTLKRLFKVGVLTEYRESGRWEIVTFRNFGDKAFLLGGGDGV